MSENPSEAAKPADAAAAEETEDDRRRRAAETNRKATDEQWQRNKKEWLRQHFPHKVGEGESA